MPADWVVEEPANRLAQPSKQFGSRPQINILAVIDPEGDTPVQGSYRGPMFTLERTPEGAAMRGIGLE
jgi:hypothetical protein